MTLVAKVLLGTLSGITVAGIGTGIAVPVVLTSGGADTQVEVAKSSLDFSECFVIPTEDNQQQNKLLMCEVKEATARGGDKKDYWYREGGTETKNTKVTTIIKKEGKMEITFEGSGSPSTLMPKVTSGSWTSIQDQTDLDSDCVLTKEEEIKWQCFASEEMVDITLTKFLEV
ncbi:hypothetical protein WEN_02295 [Mycoplasma wenyonii str. Massachusetts]|uniref:Uncharacterized protein n=1 Tax=Mycoplasma wenyonii (strain Massachusetts) TaxID=1197325 RepID=I6YBA6_MYCWM|nr:hypothetical protein [Mycoplasma wenyonii]AFN65246.1 hypothetical protein WEN_02295 [Mycoplasma wenyonii str. Massachusetts]